MNGLLTIDQAAQTCGVSRDTIQRRLREHRFPNAVKGAARGRRSAPWMIPVTDLIDAGFAPHDALLEANGITESTDDSLHCQVARLEALLLARDAHLQELRAEIRRLHSLLEVATYALAGVGGPVNARSAVQG